MTTDKPAAWLAQVRFPKEEWRTYTVHLNYADAAHWQTPPDAAVERRVIPLYGGDELDRLREDRDAFRASSEIRGAELDRLRARVAELEQARTHAGVDICEVAAAVEVVRELEVIKVVRSLVWSLQEGAFRAGFETACDEIEHRLNPCEHCDAALAKDGA